ncbi:MAG: hypothetical protein M0R17_07415 [Candidatus Omnitrophica bacterium]|jgi:hypothetical protein|nr:hypothetical protein [Candidatus Omnitrophota bacterium]
MTDYFRKNKTMTHTESNRFILKQDNTLASAIIVDIDGTTALMTNRNPYDESDMLLTDAPNLPVIELVTQLSYTNDFIIFVTGRSEKGRIPTEKWLENNFDEKVIDKSFLIMRKLNDRRPDEIIKKEIYNNQIKDKFYITTVIDDRNKVVKMWRDLGLLCLQVYDGDF